MAINTQTNSDSSQLQASQAGNIDVQGLNTSISSNDNSLMNNNVANSEEYTLPSAIEEVDLSEYIEPLVGDPRWMQHYPSHDGTNENGENGQSQIEVGEELPEQVENTEESETQANEIVDNQVEDIKPGEELPEQVENTEESETQANEIVDNQVEDIKPGEELPEQVENAEESETQANEIVDNQVENIKPGDELQNNDENPTDVETVSPQNNQVSDSQSATTNNTSNPNIKPNPKPVDDIPAKSNSIYHGDNLKSYGSKSSSSYGSKSSSTSSNNINKIRPTVDRNSDPFKNNSNYGSSQSRGNNYGSSYVGQNNYGSNGYIYHGPSSYGSSSIKPSSSYGSTPTSTSNYGSSSVGQNSYGSSGYIYHGPSSYGSSSIKPSSSYGSTQSSTSNYGSSYVGQNSYGSNGYIYHGPSSYGSYNSSTLNYGSAQPSASNYGSNGYIYHGNDLKGYGSQVSSKTSYGSKPSYGTGSVIKDNKNDLLKILEDNKIDTSNVKNITVKNGKYQVEYENGNIFNYDMDLNVVSKYFKENDIEFYFNENGNIVGSNNPEIASIFNSANNTSSQFGGNQNVFNWDNSVNLLENDDIYAILKNNMGDITDAQMQTFLANIGGNCCHFVSIANSIFQQYEGKEQEFLDKFGYSMYDIDKNGNIDYNYETLVVDLDSWFWSNYNKLADDTDYYSTSGNISYETAQYNSTATVNMHMAEHLWEHLAEEGKVHGSSVISQEDFNKESFEKLRSEGKSLIINSNYYTLTAINGCNGAEEDGHFSGHSMSVSGFTDDGFPIVSSYGGEYIMTNFSYASNGLGSSWTYFDVVG